MHVWWPNIDRDIEACVRSCECCQAIKQSIPLHGSNATLDVARETMAKSSRGLCGTSKWENVFFVDGRAL